MGRTADNRKQRTRLFHEQGGKCHWCREPMILMNGMKGDEKNFPDNMCTLEHLEDRFDPARGKYKGLVRHVAACKKCNEVRSAKRQAALPLEELHRRSNKH